ncbi:MAG TPA: GlsB/YeaQ/YmgE family stress response membrane protein [Candidatus Angelobacter sp.]|jgi:uncharacterized membrane protein YeaQ/YmgE (transglycosylase-associated protein family)
MITALIWWIIVGLIAGWLAGKIMKGSGYGTLGDILLGMVGAIVGGWILRILGFYSSGRLISSILVATLGAVFLVWLAHKLK